MRAGWRALSLVVPAWGVVLLSAGVRAFVGGRDLAALGFGLLSVLTLLLATRGERAG